MDKLSLIEGIKTFGESGNKASLAKMEQMHMQDTFKPVLLSDFSPQNKSEVLESIVLLKEKRD